MIEELISGCFETFGHWILGIVFLVAGLIVMVGAPSSENALLRFFLAFVCFHTSALMFIGFGLKKAKRLLAISWLVVLTLFIVVASLMANT